jgi:hypothetical protein
VAYVRLVPLSAERFHTSISATNNKDIKGASIQIVQNTAGAMEKLDASLKALPRTTLLAGSIAEGHLTYITRSKWMGFPEDPLIRGVTVWRPRDNKVFVAGMLHVYENLTQIGKLLINRNLDAYDIQDSIEYRMFKIKPFITKEPVIKQFKSIVKTRVHWDEDEEQSYALVKIVTCTQSTPFWCYLGAVLSSNSDYFQPIWNYLVTTDMGNDWPLFSCIHRMCISGVSCV